MHAVFGQSAKQRDGFGAHQRIQAVQRFVQHQDAGPVTDGLRELDALPHALAIAGDLTGRRLNQAHALDGLPGQIFRFTVRATVQPQIRIDELIAGESLGKGIELGAVAEVAEQLFRLIGTDAQHA